MLIRFRVANFRSFHEEQEISFVASSDDPDDERIIRPEGLSVGLLRAVAVYGANASGKSNLVKALGFMQYAVISSQASWQPEQNIPVTTFALGGEATDIGAKFEIDILVDGVRYTYGFVADQKTFQKEWLYAFPKGPRRILFEREGDTFKRPLTGAYKRAQEIMRSNSLFLSAAAQNNHKELTPIYAWFIHGLISIDALTKNDRLQHAIDFISKSDSFCNMVKSILSNVDIGFVGLMLGEKNIGGLLSGEKFIPTLTLLHKSLSGESVPIEFDHESDGTKTLIEIAFQIHFIIILGTTIIIDEIESSLHPLLCEQLLSTITSPVSNPKGGQVLFTTHNTHLLNKNLLRRDQVWFTEKSPGGATEIYSLADIKKKKRPHDDENFERSYLSGRYGAIPFLDDFDIGPRKENPDGESQ